MGKKKHAGHDAHGAATPALVALQQAEVTFELLTYEHSDHSDMGFGAEAAQELGEEPQRVFKTLLVGDGHAVGVCVIPVAGRLSLKLAAKALGMKKAALIAPADAERITGSVVGGISPLGLKHPLPVVIDAAAQEEPSVLVSAGRRGMSVRLAPEDLARTCHATFAPLQV